MTGALWKVCDREKRSALRLAVKLMEKRIGDIAFHANLEEFYAADLPVTRSASEERKRLRKAIEVLAEIEKEVCDVKREPISEALDILDYVGEANY